MREFIDFIYSNALYICIALSVILHFLLLNRRRKDLNLNSFYIFMISVLCNIMCILASKILYYIEYATSNNGTLPRILFDTGFSFYGTVYFAPIFYCIVGNILKLDVRKVLDIATPAVLISSFCCRLNCMFAGCCTGIYIFDTMLKVPTREIELSCYLGILILVLYKEHKNTLIVGTAYPTYLIIYGIVRIIEEPFRASFRNSTIHFAFIHSTISIVIGGILFWIVTKNKNLKNDNTKI